MNTGLPKSLALAVAGAMLLAACGGAATPAPTAVPPKPTEAPKPAAPTAVPPKPTDAPKPAATAVPAVPTVPPAPAGKTNLNIYLAADTNITDWYSNKLIPAFEKQFPQYKVNLVNVRGVGTETGLVVDRMLAAKQANSDAGVDVIEFDVRGRPDALKADLWEKLDASVIPNAKNVLKPAVTSEFNVPYRGSQVLLAYDSAKIKDSDVPRTFPALVDWVKKNPGQFTYGRPDKGGSGGNFVIRAIHEVTGKDPSKFQGSAPTPEQVKEWDKAWELLRSMHESTYDKGSYPAGNQPALQLLANGSVSMVSAWSDQVLQNLDKGVLPPSVKMAQFTDLPMVGGYAQLAVAKDSKNKKGAEDWINWVLNQDNQVGVIKTLGGFPALNWDQLPKELQSQFTSVIADSIPTWPGGNWDAARNKGWYENVATNIKQGS